MRTRTAVLSFCLLFVLTGTALATDGDWADAVDAAEAVDPTITPPTLLDTDVSIVGGGHVLPGSSTLDFAVSGARRSGEVRGRMTEIVGSGGPLSANVVCIGHGELPDGSRIARLVGELTEPTSGGAQTLVFDLTDSGQPGGDGDMWSGGFTTTPPLEFPCAPTGGGTPLAGGNISIR
jgi:hypothetical protein